jgi:GNAT superfamily N-acetyltransferase
MEPSDQALATVSPLLEAEIGAADALVREAGWNQTAGDWRVFLRSGTVRAIRTGAGRVVATAATLPYGGRFGWISMVLVAVDHRRQGLAKRLLRRCIDDLSGTGLVPVLDATPDGRPVYRALAFEECWAYQRLSARTVLKAAVLPAPPAGVTIRRADDTCWQALCAYDAAAFGADRSALLANMRERLPAVAQVAERAGRIVGILLGRDGRTATQVGPLAADDDAIALALLARGLDAVEGPVYIDLADAKEGLRAWLAARGFASQRPFTRMLYRRSARFDDPARTFAVAGPEFG